uniref:hypothetical protein n=1 Tax=Metallosphaera hakonensis TaxID=79601 RepID=UPI0006D0C463
VRGHSRNLTKTTNKPYPFIITSIITTDRELDNIRNNISKLKANYGLPTNMEIHASDLFHGRFRFQLRIVIMAKLAQIMGIVKRESLP